VKRLRNAAWDTLDRLGAGLMLVALSPLFLLVCVLVRVCDGRPVLFRQMRIGLGGRPFRMVKFRTMRVESDPYMRKPDDADPVVTPLGRRLRGRALDELPQLWNVVRGDMALVGPRPEMPFVVEGYGPVERLRLAAKPGLTGLWQLSRVRDRAIENHMEYDLFYVANRSVGMDVWLLWRTALFALLGTPTKIRLAVRRWESDTSWRKLVPDRSRAIARRRGRRLPAVWMGAAAAASALLVAPSLVMAVLARGDLNAARTSFLAARASLERIDVASSETSLGRADASLARAEGRLSSWVAAPGRVIPGLSANLRVAMALARSGRELVAAGRDGMPVLSALPLDGNRLVPPLANGTLDLAPFRQAAQPAARIQERVRRAERLVRASGGALLVPQVARARQEVLDLLEQARRQADVASGAAFLIPRLLGGAGKRIWLIGAENTAELRGRGGYVGALGTIEVDGGRIHLGDFSDTSDLPLPVPAQDAPGTPAEYLGHYKRMGGLQAWQNLAMSPNFPSTARVLLSRLEAAGRARATGIVSLDPAALAYLLDVTGPVRVAGIPDELTGGNVVDWTLNRLYSQYQGGRNEQRRDVLAQVARAVWQRLIDGQGIHPARLAEAMSRAIAERHLVVYSSDPEEEALIQRLGMGGEVSAAAGDYLLVFGQNLGENKMDYYLERTIDYRGRVEAHRTQEARLEETVTNTAPAGASLPSYVAGPRERLGLGLGVARTHLAALVPAGAELGDASVDGEFPESLDNRLELGRRLFGVTLDLAPGQERRVAFRYRLPDALVDGRYELTMQNQATVHPDDVSVDVQVPRAGTKGARTGFAPGGTLAWQGSVQAETLLAADLETPLTARIAIRLFGFLKRPLVSLAG
jgi:lipopolysaccharide/colanic/teichoic acid biosynthesis glycosyltransferase